MYYVPCFLPLRYVYCLEGIIFYLFFNIYFLRTKYYGGLVTKSCLTLATPQTVARQAPLSTGFSRQEHWSGLPFASLGLSTIQLLSFSSHSTPWCLCLSFRRRKSRFWTKVGQKPLLLQCQCFVLFFFINLTSIYLFCCAGSQFQHAGSPVFRAVCRIFSCGMHMLSCSLSTLRCNIQDPAP